MVQAPKVKKKMVAATYVGMVMWDGGSLPFCTIPTLFVYFRCLYYLYILLISMKLCLIYKLYLSFFKVAVNRKTVHIIIFIIKTMCYFFSETTNLSELKSKRTLSVSSTMPSINAYLWFVVPQWITFNSQNKIIPFVFNSQFIETWCELLAR